MAPTAAVRSLLGTDAALNSLGLTVADLWPANALDTPSDRDRRWGIIAWEDQQKAFGLTGASLLTLSFYQPRELGRDYGMINLMIARSVELMVEAHHVVGGDGWIMTAATWQATGPELYDNSFEAFCRYTRFRVASRHAVVP